MLKREDKSRQKERTILYVQRFESFKLKLQTRLVEEEVSGRQKLNTISEQPIKDSE